MDITSCIGDSVTHNCTLESDIHIWDIDESVHVVNLNRGTPDTVFSSGNFNFQVVPFNHSGVIPQTITTQVSFIVTADINGTQLVCRDGRVTKNEAARQETTVTIFGEIMTVHVLYY